ncbi:MAG: GNAT family N-acetyltransferase [Hyphomicrobiales bacterium]|jgi:RimJ/RimL family protein N-acetyltransferase|nr:GNAT family N-acetyltransferase [Hyphomicrobiales bacterium]
MFPDLFRDDVFTLETARLFLRWPKLSDAAEIVLLAGDRRVAEMTSHVPHPYPPEAAPTFILAARDGNANGATLRLAIAPRKMPQKLIGMVGLEPADEGGARELGYWLGMPYWGKGLMTEAAQAILDVAFLYADMPAVRASVRVVNPASRKVLEHCGFQFEGGGMVTRSVTGENVSADHYCLSRGTWASLKGWRAPLPTERPEFRESA